MLGPVTWEGPSTPGAEIGECGFEVKRPSPALVKQEPLWNEFDC